MPERERCIQNLLKRLKRGFFCSFFLVWQGELCVLYNHATINVVLLYDYATRRILYRAGQGVRTEKVTLRFAMRSSSVNSTPGMRGTPMPCVSSNDRLIP